MYLLLGILGSGLLAWFQGGRLDRIAGLSFRGLWIPLLAFGVQFLLVMFPLPGHELLAPWMPVITLGSYLLLLAFLYRNRDVPGVRIILLGTAMNFLVIALNGGYMPVTLDSLTRSGHLDRVVVRGDGQYVYGSKDVVLDPETIRLGSLSDFISIPKPLPFSATYSPGDVVLGLGGIWLVYRTMTHDGQQGGLDVHRGVSPYNRSRPDRTGVPGEPAAPAYRRDP